MAWEDEMKREANWQNKILIGGVLVLIVVVLFVILHP